MPSKYGFGNTRKKSPYRMGKAHYGIDQKNPIMKKEESKEKKGLHIKGPKETIKTMAQTLKKMYWDFPKKVWKEHGPVINPSTKNPRGIGK